jgi:hypothetical protein
MSASPVTETPSTSPAAAQPEPGEPAPTEVIVGVIAIEVHSRAADGSIQEGAQLDRAPYEAVFRLVEREIAACVGSDGERALGVDVAPAGTVSEVESIKDVPPCLPPIVRRLTFPARSLPVALTVVVSP